METRMTFPFEGRSTQPTSVISVKMKNQYRTYPKVAATIRKMVRLNNIGDEKGVYKT
jgi:hypothetical protein